MGICIIDVGEIPDVPVESRVAQTSPILSGEELPAFSVTIENEDDTTLWFHNGRPRVFSPGPSTPREFSPGPIVIVATVYRCDRTSRAVDTGTTRNSHCEAASIEDGTREIAPAEPTARLWIEHPLSRPADEPQITLEPGDPGSQEFAYAPDEDVSVEGYPEPGAYAFQEVYRFYTDGQDERGEPRYLADCGFAVRVHEG